MGSLYDEAVRREVPVSQWHMWISDQLFAPQEENLDETQC